MLPLALLKSGQGHPVVRMYFILHDVCLVIPNSVMVGKGWVLDDDGVGLEWDVMCEGKGK